MRITAAVLFGATLFFSTSIVRAEDGWGIDPKKEHPPMSSQNRIIRWCSNDGKKERFASANLAVEGFHPCGELKTPVSCDPVGQRMIGNNGQPPEVYKDCSLGPRIVVHKSDGVKIGSAALQGENPEPISSLEQAALQRDVKNAAKDQESSTQAQLERMVDGILQSMLIAQSQAMDSQGYTSKGAPGNRGGYGFTDDQIDDMVRYVDPKYQAQLKKVLQRR